MPDRTCTESFKIAADQLAETLRKLVHEGNVRRVIMGEPVGTTVRA